MKKLLAFGLVLALPVGFAIAQSVGWPPPAGMLAALGVYNSGGIVLTNAQVSPLQLDASGNLKTTASGGGGGDATAANQTLQITQETAINTVLGTTADAAATAGSTGTEAAKLRLMTTQLGTLSTNLGTINTTLGTPMQQTGGAVSGAVNVTPTNCSGTITAGGTAQNAFTAGATKHGFTIMNLSVEVMWISFTTTAAADAAASYLLNPASATTAGGSYSTPFGFGMNTALSVIGATTGNKFSCTWW